MIEILLVEEWEMGFGWLIKWIGEWYRFDNCCLLSNNLVLFLKVICFCLSVIMWVV